MDHPRNRRAALTWTRTWRRKAVRQVLRQALKELGGLDAHRVDRAAVRQVPRDGSSSPRRNERGPPRRFPAKPACTIGFVNNLPSVGVLIQKGSICEAEMEDWLIVIAVVVVTVARCGQGYSHGNRGGSDRAVSRRTWYRW